MFNIDKDTFSRREEKILAIWEREETFKKSLENRKECKIFSFYDGPPFATGLPHYGHLLAGTIKDIIPRYKTMKGFLVPRRFGWDCHGLPVENEIEKTKNIAGALEIEKFGIAAFNEECRNIVLRFVNEWKVSVFRIGRWIDFDNAYKTMDLSYMETVWWVFGQLFDLGLVYQGFKVMPFSAKLGTPLSNFEANSNYKDVNDPSLTVKIKLKDFEETYILIWTTTPWTLPMNLAVVVSDKITYVKVKDLQTHQIFIIAKDRLTEYFQDSEKIEVIETFKGDRLKDVRYEPLFDYFKERENEGAFRIVLDESISHEDGTGAMHAAPAFGEVDFFICKREEIEPVCPVDQNGKYNNQIPEYEGQFVKDADKDIIRRLKDKGLVFKHTQVNHRYPFCYRSDTPLIYKAVTTWFIAVEKIRDKIIKANEEINWVPHHIKKGRFGKWLENARDWAVSRNRYWGTPIPIWKSEDNEYIVIKSIKDLEDRTGAKIEDLHRHNIDHLTFEERGKIFKRVPEVFDCWFESGSMPYAQLHYPYENKKNMQQSFPAEFIGEGLDQTRGWFYTLNVLSTALFQKPAFKNAIVNGIVLAENGQKMSKSLKNYPDPHIVINKYGADAVRLYLLHSPVVQADDLRFSEKGVEITLRQVLLPLWNSYLFLATYANIYRWHPVREDFTPQADIDKWILSALQKLIQDVESALEDYQLMSAVDPFIIFIDKLTNWYIRRSRSRFWSEIDSQDRREAFETLYRTLITLSKIIAPFIPFLSEAIYLELKTDQDPLSVHLCDFPKVNASFRNEKLEYEMDLVQSVVSLGHALRKENKVKVRQPLKKATIVSSDQEAIEALKRQKDLICDELNVKEIDFQTDESQFVLINISPNYPVLGKKAGKFMNIVKARLLELSKKDLRMIQDGGVFELRIEHECFSITSEDILIKREVKDGLIAKSDQKITILLDTKLDQDLIMEGFAREIVNKINTMRKNEDFEVTDRVHIKIDSSELIKRSFDNYKDYICREVLAKSVSFEKCQGSQWDLNGEEAVIELIKA